MFTLVDGSKFFFSHAETICSGTTKCGKIMLGKVEQFDEEEVLLPEKFKSKDGGKYLCISKERSSHTVSCAKCLKESSDSDFLAHLIYFYPETKSINHIYVLYTSKDSSQIIRSCLSWRFCVGPTQELPPILCDSIRRNIPVRDLKNLLPAAQTYHLKIQDIESHDKKGKILLPSRQKMSTNKHCFHVSQMRYGNQGCLQCVSKSMNAPVLAVSRIFEHEQNASGGNRWSKLQPINYLFSPEDFTWTTAQVTCKLSCGTITSTENMDDCYASLESVFYTSIYHQSIGIRLDDQLRKAPTSSTKPNRICT